MNFLSLAKNRIDTSPTEAELRLVARIRSRLEPGAMIDFGVPTRCPECGDYACVTRVDEVRGSSWHRCPTCFATWRLSRRAIEAQSVAMAAVSGGVLVEAFAEAAA